MPDQPHPTTPDPLALTPPTIDPAAAKAWQTKKLASSPWLHDEVGRRMAQRLKWMRQLPKRWVHWQALNGGLDAHHTVSQFLDGDLAVLHESTPVRQQTVRTQLGSARSIKPQWMQRLTGQTPHRQAYEMPEPGSQEMVWANMALHTSDQPRALMLAWRDLLKVDGILMFSCLGPDSLLELRQIYQDLNWPMPCQAFTDMHDWGDMLIEAGFTEPVMDVERITLTYTELAPLLRDLGQWGTNLHPERQASIAPKAWRKSLEQAFQTQCRRTGRQEPFALTFEIIYGHAIKAPPRVSVTSTATVSLGDMRTMLGRRNP